MARVPSATALGFGGINPELLQSAQYAVLTPRSLVVVERGADMLAEVRDLLVQADAAEVIVFERVKTA